jgi:hypothetical protein
VACHEVPLSGDGQGPPRPTVGDIFRVHGEAYRRDHALSEEQRKVMRDIMACRTPLLGGRIDGCAHCGLEWPVYNSCRNRHCPNCQALPQARWLFGRLERLLPVDYFHVVFTVPDYLLADIAMQNRKLFFNAMFAAVSQTLIALGLDEKRLGAQLGFTAVLHTWTRDLRFHPHIHCIVTGGGLTSDGKWKAIRKSYLFPVRVMSALFRGKLVAALDDAYRNGCLELDGVKGFSDREHRDLVWRRLRRKLLRTKWVSFAKPPFSGPESVYRYLGWYTHRVGISNHRIISATNDAVTFRTRGDDTATLAPSEFIRRFLLHILPSGFRKMRHYGLLAPANVNTKLVAARSLLESVAARAMTPASDAQPPVAAHSDKPKDWRELLLLLTGRDPTRCPICGGPLYSRPLPRQTRRCKDDTS